MKRKQLTRQERGMLGFDLNEVIGRIEKNRRLSLLQISEILYKVYDKQLYKDILGDEEATWSAFLAQPNIWFSRNEIYTLFQVYEKYVKELELSFELLAEIPVSKLKDVKSIVTKENVQDWLIKAKELTPRDWKISLREAKGLPVEDNCKHNMQSFEICKNCGEKIKL